MLGSVKKSPEHLEAVERVREWTRARFELPVDAAILVSEVACTTAGCPPLETVVAFWTPDGKRHTYKRFKPVADVVYDDLPYNWLLDSLCDDDEGCECC